MYDKTLSKETVARYRSMQCGVNTGGHGAHRPIVAHNFC